MSGRLAQAAALIVMVSARARMSARLAQAPALAMTYSGLV
jgi:hypothetical protein